VTPGYYREPELTREAFDDEGFYRIGDAMKLADPDDPAKGLVFDGRVVETFKLSSGTWVHAGAVRLAIIAACDPLVQDAVITGHDRDEIGALLFVNTVEIGALGLNGAALRARLQQALVELRSMSTGSSTAPTRLLILEEPPSIDDDEITDKGYINQRAVLTRRAAHVEELYAGGPGAIMA
jgi:feruloyl-CoA synthase